MCVYKMFHLPDQSGCHFLGIMFLVKFKSIVRMFLISRKLIAPMTAHNTTQTMYLEGVTAVINTAIITRQR